MDLKSIIAKKVYVHEYFNVSHEMCFYRYPYYCMYSILYKLGTQ